MGMREQINSFPFFGFNQTASFQLIFIFAIYREYSSLSVIQLSIHSQTFVIHKIMIYYSTQNGANNQEFIVKPSFVKIPLLFLLIILAKTTRSEPIPIDLVEQHGEQNHHGHGDVVELWEENQNNPRMRNALRSNAQNRWTIYRDIQGDGKFIIPYVITGDFKEEEIAMIKEGMAKIGQNTCIKFRERRNEKDFVDIQNEYGAGCYTNVGRISGRNVLMLEATEDETCITNGTVIHELMHKIGLWHEQMRQDRDEYINVHLENIPFYLHAQFRKVTGSVATTHGVRYDYRSVMHYGQHAFASPDDAISMETTNRRFQDVIGTGKDASPGDYIKICAAYGCPLCMGEEFDAEKAAQQYGQSQEEEKNIEEAIDANDNGADENEDECSPLSLCGSVITKQSNPTLFKIACCEPCSECRPEPHCQSPHARQFPHLYKFDCCGRCEKMKGKK